MPEKILLCHKVAPETLAQSARQFPQYIWRLAAREEIPAAMADTRIAYGPLLPEQLALAKELKWVQSTSAGVEQLARSEIFQKGTFTLTTAAGMHDSCAEHALALLLGFTRRVSFYAQRHDGSIWPARKGGPEPLVLTGRTLGVLGLGAIGRSIARMARAIGMRVVGVSFHGKPVPEADETHPVRALDELLPRFDYLILALPSSSGTDQLLNAARLARLPRHAVLVNVGRGNAIDQSALVAALQTQQLAGAALDVFEQEPLPDDSPLYALSNAVLTPHIGGQRPDYHERAFEIFLDNLRRFVEGRPLRNVVEREREY